MSSNDPERADEDRYYDLFLDSDEVDWDRLAANDPRSRDDIGFLSTVDRMRKAYREQALRVSGASRPSGVSESSSVSGSGGSRSYGGGLEEFLSGSGSRPEPDDRPHGSHVSSHSGETVGLTPEFRRDFFPKVEGHDLIDEIGRGGFATIYRARDSKTRRQVALKILRSRQDLSPHALARFLREAHALASLRHENILRIHHVIDERDVLGLSMELIDGKTLADTLAQEGPFSPDEIARIGIDLCRALAEVHRAGFVHRDVKAENVMRERGGRIVLMDFGLTRHMNPDDKVTETGVLVGTPLAMAPEQYEFKDIDARTDIYSLGCLFYRLATGMHPVEGRSMEELRRKVLSGNVPRVRDLRPDFPQGFVRIISQAMAIKPQKRFQSAGELEDALLDWLENRPASGETSAPPSERRRRRRPPMPVSVILLLGGILAVLLGILIFLIVLALR